MQQPVVKRNMPSELGWGIVTEGGWSQQNSAPGSGSWTSTANQDGLNSSSWQAQNKSDNTSDPGDDASSGKSGSTITSMSSIPSQPQDTTSSNNTGILQTNSSSSWSTSNATLSSIDSIPWGSSNSPAPSGIGALGWASSPASLSLSSNNQGLNSLQAGSSIIGTSIGSASSSSAWPTGITGNSLASASNLPPNMSGGNHSNTLSSQWQGGSMLGNIGDYSKPSEIAWNIAQASVIDSNKDLGVGSSDPRMWGLSSDKTTASQWDTSKSQWGNTILGASGDQGASNTEMSFAQAALKGLKLPPITNTQVVVNSRHEEILRAIENHEGWGSRPIRQDNSWDIETSPKSLRKFPPESNAGAANTWNNSNGTAIWESVRQNKSGTWVGGGGGVGVVGPGTNSWNTEKVVESSWGGPPKPAQDANTWNVTNNADPKNFGSWGTPGGAGDASNKMWGQKTEMGSWGESGGVQRAPSISSWGDDGDAGAWEDQRRITSGMSGMQVMMPSGSGMGASTGFTGMVPQGISGVNMAAVGGVEANNWADGQKAGWNQVNNTAVTRTNVDEPWNKPPPSRTGTGWGETAQDGAEVDNGTSIWAATASKQAKPSNWGETGPQGQWNAVVGTKPKTAGWDEASLAMAQRAKMMQMPQKFVSGNYNHPPQTQMRAKLLQHLMDMGFRKEEAQSALINNNLNLEMAINDLKAGNVNLSRKDHDIDMFQANGSQSRIPYLSKGVMGGDDMSDNRPDQVPTYNNIQNTPFSNAQLSNQSFMQSNASLPPSSLISSSINSSLQQKLMQKMQQQQTPPPTPLGQRGIVPPVGTSTSSQVPQQQQILTQLRQAVSNGFISPQLLNYQLPHNMLVLLQQLLQFQTLLQGVMSKQQQLVQQARAAGGRSNPQLEQNTTTISNINQQIINVQKQLQQAQNSLFSTQKPPAVSQPATGALTSGINMVDSLDALSTDLANVALHTQSRLTTQWKSAADGSAISSPDGNSMSATALTTGKVMDENMENKAPGNKGILQSASSPNLIPGGLGMTGDKTWSTNMSTTSSSNWPLSTDASGANAQNEFKMTNSTSTPTSTLLSGLPSGLSDVIPEFIPGKPWQGLAKNVEDDPHVTPGSIQLQRSLSVNRVHDDSLNHLDGHKLGGNSSWGTSLKTDNSLGLSQLGNHPPPNMAISKGAGQQWSSGGFNRQTSWPHSSNSAFTKVSGSNWSDGNCAPVSTWILLKNLTVDPSTARALSAQHGTVISFYPLAQGQYALVQYSNREGAFTAQQRLNNFQMGACVMVAEFISDSDAQRVISQIPPPQLSAMPPMNTSPWSQAPPSTPFQNTGARGGDPWSTSMPMPQMSSKFGSAGENHWGLWDRSEHNQNPLSNIVGGESM